MRILFTMLILITSHTFFGQVLKITSTLGNTPTWKTSGSGSGARFVFHGTNVDTFPIVIGDYYLSSWTGNNGYDGLTKLTPKRTLKSMDTLINASTLPAPIVAIEGGSIFAGSEGDGISLTRGRVSFRDYNRGQAGKYNFPRMYGTDVHNTGWALVGTNYYQKNIPNSITLTYGNYAYLSVIEIDTLLERTQPFTARRYLTSKANLTQVDTTAGTYFCPLSSGSPALISVHTSDGLSPNNHPNYRYEVVVRDGVIERKLNGDYGAPVTINEIIAIDYGRGAGAIASRQDSFTMKRSVIAGIATHSSSVGNFSTIDTCGFIGGDQSINGNNVVFYRDTGRNDVNTVQNSIFLEQARSVYTHTGTYGYNHAKLNFKNNYVYASTISVLSSANCDTIDVDGCYGDSISAFVLASNPTTVYFKNSIVKRANTVLSLLTSNVMVADNNLLVGNSYTGAALIRNISGHSTITNNTFHLKNRKSNGDEGGTFIGYSDTSQRYNVTNNIFVGECLSGDYINVSTCNDYGGAGTGPDIYDYNAYILVSGLTFRWFAKASGWQYNFTNWKIKSGQDAHSILIDLRANPAGLNAIFVDPENGDYRFANTPQADSVQAIVAGMTTPPVRFPNQPSREAVVEEIESNEFISPRNRLY